MTVVFGFGVVVVVVEVVVVVVVVVVVLGFGVVVTIFSVGKVIVKWKAGPNSLSVLVVRSVLVLSCSTNQLDSVIESMSSSSLGGSVGIHSVTTFLVVVVVVGRDVLVVGVVLGMSAMVVVVGLAVRSRGATIGFHKNLEMASQLVPFWEPVSLRSNASSVSLSEAVFAKSDGPAVTLPAMAFTTDCSNKLITFLLSLDFLGRALSQWHRWISWVIINEMIRHLIFKLTRWYSCEIFCSVPGQILRKST